MRTYNKWYKEIWWWIQEQFAREAKRAMKYKISNSMETQELEDLLNSGWEIYKEYPTYEYVIIVLCKEEDMIIPMTKQAKKHMEKVHKEKGMYPGGGGGNPYMLPWREREYLESQGFKKKDIDKVNEMLAVLGLERDYAQKAKQENIKK